MDPERWQRIESIFQKALDAGEDRRARVLVESCADDEALRREVESLLAQHEKAGGFMERPAFAGSQGAPLSPQPRSEDSHSAGIPAGTVIGHYRIVGKIGSGGMGVVYDAEDLKLRRHVALKFLPEEVAGQPRVLQRFRLEAQAASALNHPNICTIHEVDEVNGMVFIVMELLEGQTLKQTIAGKPLPLETVIDFGVQIAGAIDAAHAKGVVHRDIKPANIFVMKQRRVKVLDFGLAKLTRLPPNFEETGLIDRTEPGTVMGTAGYMSPEQVRGLGVDGRTDIFAFGAILYEMLAGRRAFEKSTSADTMAAILNEEPPTISELAPNTPPALVRIVKRCLDKDPEQRFQSASDLAFALQALPESSGAMPGTVIEPVFTAEPARGLRSRPRWLKVAAGALSISVVALATVVAYRWHQEQPPLEQAALTAVPFTALPEEAISAAFSPDGSRIAFAWNGDPAHGVKGFDLYAKALGSETLLRLTQHPSESISPVWSPDGTQIAFQRLSGGDSGIYVVPALGGPERKLHPTGTPADNFSWFSWHSFAQISWSPDGKWIAFADMAPGEEYGRIYLLSTETLETKQVPISPNCVGEGLPAFSHNGEYLAYWCFLSENGEAVLQSLPIRGSQPKTIPPSQRFPNGLTWSADDEKLIYSLISIANGTTTSELSQVTVANGSTKQLAFAGGAMLPAVSARNGELAYSSLSTSLNIWRRDLLHPESPAVELMPSSRAQTDAQYSPDGKRIVFDSFRSGIQGVWISADDGSNLVQISNPQDQSGSPQWSPDGNKIAFDSRPRDHWEIYVADVDEGKPRKLVTNISSVIRPHWSRDGKWIYFRSDGPGRTGVYRCPAAGGKAIALSQDTDGLVSQESFDGKTLYFASSSARTVLRKVSLRGLPGTASEGGDGLPRVSNAAVWTVSPGGIYFVPAEAPKSLRYFDFATRQIRPIFEVDKYFGSGLSVSPDGRWILYSLVGNVNSDIMLVDHFQ
jgi:Tol biopolymer transport system component